MPLKQIIQTGRYSDDMGDVSNILDVGGNCETGAQLIKSSNEKHTDYKYEKTKRYIKIRPETLYHNKNQNIEKGSIFKVACGLLLIILAILGLTHPLIKLLLAERLNMRPGLPAFNWWSNPPETMKMMVNIFNVTNHQRFLAGLDDKINVKEIGPIVYCESFKFSNIQFKDNDTLKFNFRRDVRFSPDESKLHLNATLIVPNYGLLGVTSMLQENDKFYYRMAFNWLLKIYPNNLFVETTVYNYLWHFYDRTITASQKLAPGMMPSDNLGLMARLYELFQSEVTVKIGPRWGDKQFFQIYEYKDLPQFSGHDLNICLDNPENATEGVLFPQNLKKDDVLFVLSKPMCKLLPLVFHEELNSWGLTYYRYNFSRTVFDRKPDMPNCHNDKHILPSGLQDSSKCFFDFPLVLSHWHFYGVDTPRNHYVTGLHPDPMKHQFGYYDIEPLSGIPITLNVKLQCNLWIRNITGLYPRQFDKFSNLVIPLTTLEYRQESLPTHVTITIHFAFVILPVLSTFILCCILLLGIIIIVKQSDNNRLKAILNIFGLRSVSH